MPTGERRSGGKPATLMGDMLVSFAEAEAVAQRANASDARSEDDLSIHHSDSLCDERRWSRPSRLLFTLGAAAFCWALPIVAAYWLAS